MNELYVNRYNNKKNSVDACIMGKEWFTNYGAPPYNDKDYWLFILRTIIKIIQFCGTQQANIYVQFMRSCTQV